MGSRGKDKATRTRNLSFLGTTLRTFNTPYPSQIQDGVFWICFLNISLHDCHEVLQARLCGKETFFAWGEVQRGQGDGEQQEGVQGGQQEPEHIKERSREPGESAPISLHG